MVDMLELYELFCWKIMMHAWLTRLLKSRINSINYWRPSTETYGQYGPGSNNIFKNLEVIEHSATYTAYMHLKVK